MIFHIHCYPGEIMWFYTLEFDHFIHMSRIPQLPIPRRSCLSIILKINQSPCFLGMGRAYMGPMWVTAHTGPKIL